MHIAITGINGFVGHHLARTLHEAGHEVLGIGQQVEPAANTKEFIAAYHACDLTNQDEVSTLPLEEIDAIINLAGLADVGKSFAQPELYLDVNVKVLSVLCDRIKQLGLKKLRMLAISSGAVYGPNQPQPLNEQSQTDAQSSPYAASKLAMERVALDFRRDGFDCIIARPFNHIGPGQAAGFILPDLHAKLRSAATEIHVGNLETKRDYTDVRDVARAYLALTTATTLKHDTYNVCSGHATSGLGLLEELKRVCDKPDIKTIIDQNLFRPSDTPILYGDNSRLAQETSWRPTIPLSQTLDDFVAASL